MAIEAPEPLELSETRDCGAPNCCGGEDFPQCQGGREVPVQIFFRDTSPETD